MNTYPSYAEAAEQIIDCGKRLYQKSFVASNDGNISVRVGDDEVMITPSGISKGELTPDILLRVTLDGRVLEGHAKPSTETAMHLRVYRENPEVRVCVHAHPSFATAFAIAHMPLDRPIYPEALVILGERGVPCAPYATPGTSEVPDSIAPYCRDYHAVLLANHGALTWGKDMHTAWFRMESLENYAKVTLYSRFLLGQAHELTPEQITKVFSIY